MPRIPAWLKVAWHYTHQSLLEFAFLVLMGLMPVWLGALIRAGQGREWQAYLGGYLSGGEALLLATATVGPLLYLVVASDFGARQGSSHFPLKGWYVFAILLVCVSSAGLFGFKAGHEGDGGLAPDAIWWISVLVVAFSAVLWFAISATNAVREHGAADVMRQDEHDFVKGY